MVAYVNGNGVRPGYVIKYNDKIYRVMTSEHRSPGKDQNMHIKKIVLIKIKE